MFSHGWSVPSWSVTNRETSYHRNLMSLMTQGRPVNISWWFGQRTQPLNIARTFIEGIWKAPVFTYRTITQSFVAAPYGSYLLEWSSMIIHKTWKTGLKSPHHLSRILTLWETHGGTQGVDTPDGKPAHALSGIWPPWTCWPAARRFQCGFHWFQSTRKQHDAANTLWWTNIAMENHHF